MFSSHEFRRHHNQSHSPPPQRHYSPNRQSNASPSNEIQYVNGMAYFPQPASSPPLHTQTQQPHWQRRNDKREAVTLSGQHIFILPSARNCEVSTAVQLLS